MSAERTAGGWLRAHRTLLEWLVVAALCLLLARNLAHVWRVTNHHDLDVFMLAAERLVAGEDLFADAAPFQEAVVAGTFSMDDDTVVWPYVYPPLIALLFVPTLSLPLEAVRLGWWLFNVVCLLAGTGLCLSALGRVTPLRAGLALLLLWRFEPVRVALRLGQIEVLQFLLLAAALYALSTERDRWAGLALGLATGLKFFPGALIVLLLWARRWRAAAWAAAVAALTIVGSFAVVGLDALASYWRYTGIYGIAGAFAAFPLNQSLNGFFSRNLVRNVFTATLKGLHLPALARILTLGADAVIVTLSAWLTWSPQRDRTRSVWATEYGLAVTALLLISPHSQVYTFVWALIPLLVLGIRLLEREADWGRWLAYIAAFVLIGRAVMIYSPGVTRFFASHYMFGALLLWALLALELWGRRRRTAVEQGAV
ncbi:MAG: DUF2029 domain-containing protein [Chloroflexi bacterium]|nr:DUF2029 domain-containing protein [Chloroflexota bacterium]